MPIRNLRLFPPIIPPDVPGPDLGAPGSRRRLILMGAALTMITEILSLLRLLPLLHIGGINLSASTVPALALAVGCGDRLLGRSSLRRLTVWFWLLATGTLLGLLMIYLAYDRGSLYLALLLAALNEELVYRLAVPVMASVALMFTGMGMHRARLVGFALAGVWFVFLPGHQAQMDTPTGPLPFIAYAVLSAALVYRSGSIIPMAAVHAVMNMITLLVWHTSLPLDARAISLAALFGLLALAYGLPRRLTIDGERGMVDTFTGLRVVEIDHSGDGPPEVHLSDGSHFSLHHRVPR